MCCTEVYSDLDGQVPDMQTCSPEPWLGLQGTATKI